MTTSHDGETRGCQTFQFSLGAVSTGMPGVLLGETTTIGVQLWLHRRPLDPYPIHRQIPGQSSLGVLPKDAEATLSFSGIDSQIVNLAKHWIIFTLKNWEPATDPSRPIQVSPAPPPERPVPPEQPASVAKLASALVAHFGSLPLGLGPMDGQNQ